MKTIFEQETIDELIQRIHSLREDNKPLWKKINVYQMTKHITYWNELDELTGSNVTLSAYAMDNVKVGQFTG